MKLYTRTGDRGETSLGDGTRVSKDDPRVAAGGDLDELNAALGWCRAAPAGEAVASETQEIQQELCALASELATPSDSKPDRRGPLVGREQCQRLERWIDQAAGAVEPLQDFVLPAGTELACRLHLARTCCRRAERSVVTLARSVCLRPEVICYLNRLGDLLFAWARRANRDTGRRDIIWVRDP